MGKRLLGVMISTIFFLIIVNALAFAVPMTINYQGKLTESNGSVLNGVFQISFSLFNTDTNGTALWVEHQTVTVINGIYNVALGAVSPLTASIFDNENLYLEVGIETETLSPRHRLTSVAFAIRAKEAETVGGFPIEDLVTETEFENKITTNVFADDQIPDDITVNHALNADTVDGKDSTEFGDGHSLDAVDGSPVDAVYVDGNGNVGIGTISPMGRLDVGGGDLVVDTNNSNVGIGTTSPSANLEVAGTVKATAFIGDGSGLTGTLLGFHQVETVSELRDLEPVSGTILVEGF